MRLKKLGVLIKSIPLNTDKTGMDEREALERREHERFPYNDDVLIGNKIKVEPVDISEGGIYILSERSFMMGSTFDLYLPFRGKKLKVRARVQHKQAGAGMGLMFVDVEEEQKEKIRDLIEDVKKNLAEIRARMQKILLIDDNVLLRKICRCRLNSEGYILVEAENGLHAVDMLKDASVVAIVLNMDLQGMDSHTVLGMLKRSIATRHIPVITFAEEDTRELRQRVCDAGAAEFIPLSITEPAILVNTVKKVLSSKQAAV